MIHYEIRSARGRVVATFNERELASDRLLDLLMRGASQLRLFMVVRHEFQIAAAVRTEDGSDR